MRKAFASVFSAAASFLLILCLAFTCVQIVVNDRAYLENEFMTLGNYTEMNMSHGDVCKAANQLISYMQGRADSISATVTVDGAVTDMFVLDIEFTHMQEVRTLWLQLVKLRNFGLLLSALLYLLGALIDLKNAWRNFAGGYIVAISVSAFGGAFFGTWAALDFSSFWTAFHHLIFPTSTNWALPAESRMIQMLTEDFFSAMVARIAVFIIVPLALLLAAAILILIFVKKPERKGKKPKKNADADVEYVWKESDGPDLLAEHRLRNMTVSAREQLEEEEARTEAIRAEIESFGQKSKKKKKSRK